MAHSSAVPQRRGHQLCTLCGDLTQPPQRALITETDLREGKPELKAEPSMTAKPGAAQKAFVLAVKPTNKKKSWNLTTQKTLTGKTTPTQIPV